MRSLNLSKYLCFYIYKYLVNFVNSEESVDIWKKEIKKDEKLNIPTKESKTK